MGRLTLVEKIQFVPNPHATAAPDVHRPLPRRSSRKWAKRIRKLLGYHPTDERKYMDTSRRGNEKYGGGEWLVANCSRVKYQLMKGRTA